MNKDKISILEKKGVEVVLLEMAQGHHGNKDSPLRSEVDAWILSKTVSNRDAREKETLVIAKEANRLASEANVFARDEAAAAARSARWAKIAAIVAAIAAIMSITATMIIALFIKKGNIN